MLLFGLAACGGLGVEQYREAEPHASLELRLVAPSARQDVDVLPRMGSAEPVSLERGAVLRAAHIARVQLVESGDGVRLLVLQLRDEGRVRLREATAGAEGRPVAIVVDGRVIATPSIRGALDQNEIAVRVDAHVVEDAYAALHR